MKTLYCKAIAATVCCLLLLNCAGPMNTTLDMLVYERDPTFRYSINEDRTEGVYFVTEVIDGITLKLNDERKVKLIGLELPEIDTPYYEQALNLVRTLAVGKHVILFRDTACEDGMGNLLAYVHIYRGNEKVFLNELLLREGMARVKIVPPNDDKKEPFLAAQREAREKMKGLWSIVPYKEVSRIPEEIKGVALRYCIGYALARSDTMKDANAEWEIARREYVETLTGLVPFPEISASYTRGNDPDNPSQRTTTREGTVSTSIDDTFWTGLEVSADADVDGSLTRETIGPDESDAYDYSADFSLRQPLLKGMLDFSKIEEREALESAWRDYITIRGNLILSVVSKYFQLIRLEEDRITSLRSYERNLNTLKKMEAEAEAGKVKGLDLIRQRTQLERAAVDVKDAEKQIIERRREFNDLVGFPKDQATTLSTELRYEPIEVNVENLVEEAFQERLDLVDRRESLKRAQENFFRAKTNLLPELDLFLTYSVGNSDTDFSRMFDNSGRPSWSSGLEFSYSLDRSPFRTALYRAEEKLRKTERSYKDFEESIVEEIEDYKRSVELNELDIRLARRDVDIAEQQFLLDREDYEMGRLTSVEFVRRENELNEKRRTFYRRLETQQSLRFELEQIKGVLGKQLWIARYLSDE